MLDDAGCANALNTSYTSVKLDQSQDYLKILNKTLDTYCQMADVSNKNITIITSAGSMDIKRKEPKEQTLEVATKFMTYWAIMIATIGVPNTLSQGGVIVSIVNDAASYIPSLKSDLDDLARTASPGDNYKKFTKLLFDYAKKVKWTVTETYPDPKTGSPVTIIFTENVS